MKKLIKASIDNKNICTDFADVFHNGDYVEKARDKNHVQLFFFEGKAFRLYYVFGQNIFHLECLDSMNDCKIIDKVRAAISELNTDHIRVIYSDYAEDGTYTLTAQFFFDED